MKRALAAVRKARSDLLEVAGFVLLVAAAWTQLGTAAGLAAAGVALVVIGRGIAA